MTYMHTNTATETVRSIVSANRSSGMKLVGEWIVTADGECLAMDAAVQAQMDGRDWLHGDAAWAALPPTVCLFSDPNAPGLAYSIGAETSGPAGPDRSDMLMDPNYSQAELRDTIADDANYAIDALEAAELVVDVFRSPRGQDGIMAHVTVTSWVAAARILERL